MHSVPTNRTPRRSPIGPSLLLVATAIVGLLLVAGCTRQEDAAAVEMRSNMRALAVCYGDYMKANRGRVPKNEKTFRKWLEKRGDDYLDSLKVDSLDDVFISSRDNEPYVVIYGKPKSIVAYESVGIDGKRYVADDLGVATEVDEARFRELVPDAE